MTLSVLIPSYNYDCSVLVAALKGQCDACGVDYEIVVADDGSDRPVWRDVERTVGGLTHCRFIRRDMNVGRSRIRNFLASEAGGRLLLFMDQDGKVVRDDFVQRYLDAAENHDVVCGGIIHPEEAPSADRSLRYRYEKDYENRLTQLSGRRQKPGRSSSVDINKFRSFCFLVRREVAETVTMDGRFGKYGYEDVKYGIDLHRAGYEVHHIDNPLMNDEIETNPHFVRKTETALENLRRFKAELKGHVTVLDRAEQLRRMGLTPLLRLVSAVCLKPLRRNLCGSRPAVRLFNLYKLLYYISIDDD